MTAAWKGSAYQCETWKAHQERNQFAPEPELEYRMCAMCYCCCFYARRRPTTQEQQGCAGGNNGLLIINLSIPENRISQQTTDIVLVFRRSDAECSVLGCVGAAACQCCYVVAKDHPSATNHPPNRPQSSPFYISRRCRHSYYPAYWFSESFQLSRTKGSAHMCVFFI